MTQVHAGTAPVAVSPSNSIVASSAVSARVLKKRETDRKCQRMIRERTKSRIAYLENLVEQFRQQDSSGRIQNLMAQLSDMKTERDNLAKKVKNIESIISDGAQRQDLDSQSPAQSDIQDAVVPGRLLLDSHETVTESSKGSNYRIFNKEFEARSSVPKATWATAPVMPPEQPCECSTPRSSTQKAPVNKWIYANDTLTEWFNWPQLPDMRDFELFNDDVPVRAVVEGWDAVERRGKVHPGWQLLRGIDQTIFSSCEKTERLAIMHVMWLLLSAHLAPSTEKHAKLPLFYLKRPSQDMLHSYATEYFAWPGLRERFVFSEHRYCSNGFWKVFCESIHVLWPFEFRDCYVRNTETGLYKISPTFNERVSDIKVWTMGREMFKRYPELYGDIPAYCHIPPSLSPSNYGVQRLLQPPPSKSPSDSATQGSGFDQEATISKPSETSPMTTIGFMPDPSGGTAFVQSMSVVPTSNYDFVGANMVPNVSDSHHFPNFNAWGYNVGLDSFQLDAA